LSAVDWQKRCLETEKQLAEAQQQTKLLTEELNTRMQRFVKRENDYKSLIQNLEEELRGKMNLDFDDPNIKSNINRIYTDHQQIIDNINNLQVKTSKVLLDQEKDIIRFFNSKIQEIKKQFEEEKARQSKK